MTIVKLYTRMNIQTCKVTRELKSKDISLQIFWSYILSDIDLVTHIDLDINTATKGAGTTIKTSILFL